LIEGKSIVRFIALAVILVTAIVLVGVTSASQRGLSHRPVLRPTLAHSAPPRLFAYTNRWMPGWPYARVFAHRTQWPLLIGDPRPPEMIPPPGATRIIFAESGLPAQ